MAITSTDGKKTRVRTATKHRPEEKDRYNHSWAMKCIDETYYLECGRRWKMGRKARAKVVYGVKIASAVP